MTITPRYTASNTTSKFRASATRKYTNFNGTPPKKKREERMTNNGIVKFQDVIDVYAKAIAMQITGEPEATPTEEDKLRATRLWKELELDIQKAGEESDLVERKS